jgi:hypothetical protein
MALLLALSNLVLWCFSLQWVNIRSVSDLGLVSVLPLPCIIALGILTLVFCLSLTRLEGLHPTGPLLYLLVLIFMLYASPALVEQAPRFAATYWLAGHTEYVLRTGSVNPFVDAYFNWPGFFILTGLLTTLTGLSSVLAFAPWASFAYNLLYLVPMYLIFKTATSDRRTIWLGLWFFYIGDWVWQDYFDPQGLNFFFYLVIIAIVLKAFKTTRTTSVTVGRSIPKRRLSFSALLLSSGAVFEQLLMWFQFRIIRPVHIWIRLLERLSRIRQWSALSDAPSTPEQRRKRLALLITLIAIFALSVTSHPITPFFVLLSVTALTLFGKIKPRWLPLLLLAMILTWDFTVARPYMAGHLRSDLAFFGNIQVVASANVTERLSAGSLEHQFISNIRVLLTAAIWVLAILGAFLRWRNSPEWSAGGAKWRRGNPFSYDMTFILLAIAPGFLVVAQPYGGEMAMRYYLFTLPIISFFAAAAFRTPLKFRTHTISRNQIISNLSRWLVSRSELLTQIAVIAVCLLLLGGFLFARYGNERADYVTYDEASAVAHLYSVAPPHSLLLEGWSGTPWRYQDLDLYDYSQLYTGQNEAEALESHNIGGILAMASNTRYTAVYVIFSRSQKAEAQMFAGVTPAAFAGVENALLQSGRFELIFSNRDAEILEYIYPQQESAPEVYPIARGQS